MSLAHEKNKLEYSQSHSVTLAIKRAYVQSHIQKILISLFIENRIHKSAEECTNIVLYHQPLILYCAAAAQHNTVERGMAAVPLGREWQGGRSLNKAGPTQLYGVGQ